MINLVMCGGNIWVGDSFIWGHILEKSIYFCTHELNEFECYTLFNTHALGGTRY